MDGRADHEARRRQRHLAPDLRVDPHLGPVGHQRRGSTAAPWRSSSSRSSRSAIIVAVVFMQEGQRRIPIQYAKRMVGRRMTAGGSTYMPLRVNMAGVIPVIFAAAVMPFPPTIAQFFPQTQGCVNQHFTQTDLSYLLLEGAAHHHLHVLLHGGPVQPRRPGRQPAQERRLHPGHPSRARPRRTTSTACSRG